MDQAERERRAAVGQQNSSLEYVKYFCICDCITLGMPDGYTAMGAGLELFLEKFKPGEKYIQPYAMKVPAKNSGSLRPFAYKIPKKIDAFLWSPFHDALSTYWNLGDGCRHSYRFKGQILREKGLASKMKAPPLREIEQQIYQMDKKVDEIWNNPKKILVLYDHSRFQNCPAKQRLIKFNQMAQRILKWPEAKMKLTQYDAKDKSEKATKCWWGWEHYAKESRTKFYNEIKQLAK